MALPITSTRWSLCLVLAAALSAPAIAAETPEPGRIHVTGTGEVDVAPDKATLTARLWEQTAFVKAENAVRIPRHRDRPFRSIVTDHSGPT